MRGASATMDDEIPVSMTMFAGMGWPGLIRVPNRETSSPPRYFTAPISVMAPKALDDPVVSRSTTQKVTWESNVLSEVNDQFFFIYVTVNDRCFTFIHYACHNYTRGQS